MDYTMTAHLDQPLGVAEKTVREALAGQGFGILTEIDVEATFRKKLGDEAADAVGPYKILGACNPTLASTAIGKDVNIGALLPCNVVLRASEGGTEVIAADPDAMLGVAGDALCDVASDARQRISAALASLG